MILVVMSADMTAGGGRIASVRAPVALCVDRVMIGWTVARVVIASAGNVIAAKVLARSHRVDA